MSRKINDENQYLVDNNVMDTLTRFLGKSDAQQRTEQELSSVTLQTEDKIKRLEEKNEALTRDNEHLQREHERILKDNEHLTREKNNILEDWKQEQELHASGVARLTDLEFVMKLKKDYTYYEVLHVSSSATQEVIRSAFLDQITIWRDKKNEKSIEKQPNSVEQEAIDLIHLAYSVLRSKKSRNQYDSDVRTEQKNRELEILRVFLNHNQPNSERRDS
jgi:hypothetical protein